MAAALMEIDGGILEGGGQILRIASALSCITSTPIAVNNIRAGRKNPGLRPQHLSGLELSRDLSGGVLNGGEIGSQRIELFPKTLKSGKFLIDTKTAGSVCLLIQSALPCTLFSDGEIEIVLKGGTNADMAPPIDYFNLVVKPTFERFGINFDCQLIKRGFYPRGRGEVVLRTRPVKFVKAVELLDFGEITQIHGCAYVAGTLPIKMAHAMADVSRNMVERRFSNVKAKVDVVKETDQTSFGNGSGIILVAETSTGCILAGSELGSRDKKAEDVGRKAGEKLIENLDHAGCVDEYLQDQLIIFMALARGKSRILSGPITLHTETAIHVTQILTQAKFTIEKISENRSIIECDGIGFENQNLS